MTNPLLRHAALTDPLALPQHPTNTARSFRSSSRSYPRRISRSCADLARPMFRPDRIYDRASEPLADSGFHKRVRNTLGTGRCEIRLLERSR